MTALKLKEIVLVRRTLFGVLVLGLAAFVVLTAGWHMMWDTQVMHYVDFLIAHGFAPYRTIGDMNMPGAYWSEHFGIALFGPSDLSWRLYEFFLLGLLTWGMILIAAPYDRLAGLLAGVLFILTHGLDLANNAVQRDEVMTVALVLAVALLFAAVRRNAWLFALAAGLLFGYAAAIKPTALLLACALLAGMCIVQRKQRLPCVALLAAAVGGVLCVAVGVWIYLAHFAAIPEFLFILRKVIPAYAPMTTVSFRSLTAAALNPLVWVILPFALAAFLSLRSAKERVFQASLIERWEGVALVVSSLFGIISYFLQHKGYPYHRYPGSAFLLLLIAIVLLRALRGACRSAAVFSLLGLVFVCAFAVPVSLAGIAQGPAHDVFADQLAADLKIIGPDRLQRQIQCLDVVFGCMNALYHDSIVQNYGATGDLLYFQPQATPVVLHYREEFWQHLQQAPPAAFVLSNQWFGEQRSFNKLQAWPAFAEYLQANYREVIEREFPGHDQRAYRLYIRNGSPLLISAESLTR